MYVTFVFERQFYRKQNRHFFSFSTFKMLLHSSCTNSDKKLAVILTFYVTYLFIFFWLLLRFFSLSLVLSCVLATLGKGNWDQAYVLGYELQNADHPGKWLASIPLKGQEPQVRSLVVQGGPYDQRYGHINSRHYHVSGIMTHTRTLQLMTEAWSRKWVWLNITGRHQRYCWKGQEMADIKITQSKWEYSKIMEVIKGS